MDPFQTGCAVKRRPKRDVAGVNATRVGLGAGILALPRQEQEKGFEWGDVSAAYGEA